MVEQRFLRIRREPLPVSTTLRCSPERTSDGAKLHIDLSLVREAAPFDAQFKRLTPLSRCSDPMA